MTVLIKLLLLKKSHALNCPTYNVSVLNITLPTLPNSYQSDIEVNIVDKGYTLEASVYRDFEGNRAAVKIFDKGYDRKYIYSYATNEIFKMSETGCTVEQLSASNDTYFTWLFGYIYTNMGLHIPMKQQTAYSKNYGEAYVGNDTIRGIPVDHWQQCLDVDPYKKMIINYYFTHTDRWNTASNYSRVPIRTEVMADKLQPDGTIYTVHHVYNYFNFLPVVNADPTVFQTSPGVFCPGRNSTKPLPKLEQRFYCRTEIIYSARALVTYVDEWYDASFKIYRKDYKPLTPQYPTFTTQHPITEIHDFYIGARYVIDKTQGNCTVLPLSNSSSDTIQNITAEQINGSYILNLKTPLQLFHLDWNYTYIGQVWERGVLCDVYVTMERNIYIDGILDTANTTITFYFLAQDWDVQDNGLITSQGYGTPVKMVLQVAESGVSLTYNYIDFAIMPMLENYDISACYPEAHTVKLQVRFSGTIQPNMAPYIKDAAQMMFAQQHGVTWLRIQNVGLVYDDAYIYISYTLLDKAPPIAQFEYIPGKVIEKHDDAIIYNVTFPMECATFCVNEQRFICNSFDFCSNECRLSRAHIGDGSTVVDSKTCDHFSRSVNGVRDEPSILDAFNQLRMKVYNRSVIIPGTNPGEQFVASEVSVIFGWITPRVTMPKIGNYLHYRIEASVPAQKYIYEGEIWYDRTFQLVRFDPHFNRPVDTYPPNPMTIIADFSTGLQYVINRVYKNCTIQAIPADDSVSVLTTPGQNNSTWSLRMKTPNELLHIDDTYKFVGQQTARGMLCNVFESLRKDYKVPTLEGYYEAVFRYFFLAEGWYQVSEEYGGASGEPVRLEVTVPKLDFFLEYNLFDYNNDRPDISTYDIHQCFDTMDQKTFQITFPGPYHPYLDASTSMFQTEVVFAMARLTRLPPLRFQRTRLDYDRKNVYITTTMVGEPDIPTYFTHITNGSVVEHASRIVPNVQTAQFCAQSCFTNTGFVCNSFYFCASNKQCLLSKQNVPNGPKQNIVPGCEAYSRTVTARDYPPPSGLEALTWLKNSIYRGQLKIIIPGPGPLEPHTYTASMVRTDIVEPGTHTKQNAVLQEFTIKANNSKLKDFDSELNNLSVDDCALACETTADFQCHGFYYCDTSLNCGLIKTRPDQLPPNGTVQSDSCYIYQRTYLDDYIMSFGLVSMTTADSTVTSVNSTGDCAKTCTQETSFQCKSFEFCESTSQCLLFSGRTVGKPIKGNNTCYQFRRDYTVDFKPVNSGTYKFASVLKFTGVSVSFCAQFCIEQQGSACHGFYFCQQTMDCYLTSIQSQSGQPQVQVDTSTYSVLCNYYTRLGGNQNTTSQPILSSSSTSSSSVATKSAVSQPASQKTVIPSSSQGLSVTGASPTPLGQTSDNNKKNTGTIVGVAFGTFILGLIVGAAILFIFNKYRSRSHEEYEMHITKHEM